MKSLYTDKNTYTEEAKDILHEIKKALTLIFNKFIEKGYNPKELSLMIIKEAIYIEARMVLTKQYNKRGE